MAPQIREFTPDAPVAGPYDTRQARNEDNGNVGDSLSRVGSVITDVGNKIHERDVQNEITDATAQMAQAHADLTDNLKDTLQSADPTDTSSISDNFMQGYDDQMSAIGNNLSTPEAQKYFQRANAQMRAHFTVSSMQGQAALAGQKAVSDYQSAASNWNSSLVTDPSSFPTVVNLHNQLVDSMVNAGTLPSGKADELKQQGQAELAKSAVRGMIESPNPDGPAVAKDQLSGGLWDSYLNGDQKYQMLKESDQGMNAKRIEAERQANVQRQAVVQAQTDQQNNFLQQMVNNNLSSDDILKSNLDPFGSGSKEQFLKMNEAAQNQKIKTDPDTYLNLFERIHADDTDPNKINDQNQLNQYFGKGLDINSLNALRNEVAGKKTEAGQIESDLKKNFVEGVKGQLTKTNPLLGMRDPDGDEQYQGFLSTFLPAYDAQRKAGKTPTDLLNPSSPDYMGKMAKTFNRTPEQIMQSMANQFNPPADQPAPVNSNAPSSTTTQSAAVLPSEPQRKGGPAVGTLQNGYKFKGGDPSSPTSWEKAN